MKGILTIIIIHCTLLTLAQSNELEEYLSKQAGVSYEKIDCHDKCLCYAKGSHWAAYNLLIEQPLDHNHPEKGSFNQRVYLHHRSFDRPTYMHTAGYSKKGIWLTKKTLEYTIKANAISVEHRYYGKSVPENPDYQYLTSEQSAMDLHRVKQIFDNIYKKKWVTGGSSKAGYTAIYYKYFYPEDIDVTLPFNTGLHKSLENKAFYKFFDRVGTAECRAKIYNFQKRLLSSRDTILALLKEYVPKHKYTYEHIGLESAFEYAVMEYEFAFWQLFSDCSLIPDKNIDIDSCFKSFLKVSNINYFSDQYHFETDGLAFNYEVATEHGYHGYRTAKFKGLIKTLPTDSTVLNIFLPEDVNVTYSNKLNLKVLEWLKTNGNNMIYINGALDPYSVSDIPESEQTNSLWFKLEDNNHRARVWNLSHEQQELYFNTLGTWLGETIKYTLPNNN